jgi:hypothetical protein
MATANDRVIAPPLICQPTLDDAPNGRQPHI